MYRDREGWFHYQGDFEAYDGYYLPHWDVEDGVYFVTFRLADSIPSDTVEEFSADYRRNREESFESEDQNVRDHTGDAFQRYVDRLDARLDEGRGACHLRDDRVAQMVAESIRHFDGERYDLFTWVVMPNHVHVTFRRRPGHPLGKVVGGWKSYTAHRAREFADFGSQFWQPDYFDRLIRSEREFERVCEYVWKNPEHAGLENWTWRGIERSG